MLHLIMMIGGYAGFMLAWTLMLCYLFDVSKEDTKEDITEKFNVLWATGNPFGRLMLAFAALPYIPICIAAVAIAGISIALTPLCGWAFMKPANWLLKKFINK